MARLEGIIHFRDAGLIAVEGGGRGLLRNARGIGGRLALDGGHRRDDLARAAAVTDAPAGHGIALGHAIDGDGAVVQLRHCRQQAAEGFRIPEDLLVHVIGADDDARMIQQHLAQRAQFGARVGGAGGIAGAVQQNQPASSA